MDNSIPVPSLQRKITEAHRRIAYLNGVASRIADIDVYAHIFVRREALLSCRMEGSECTLEDVLDPMAGSSPSPLVRDVMAHVETIECGLSAVDSHDDDSGADPIVQASLIPIQCGDGRLGRLQVLRFLLERRILDAPLLCISHSLWLNGRECCDRLDEARRGGDCGQWVGFFVDMLTQAAEDSVLAIDRISHLHDHNLIVIAEHLSNRRAVNVLKVFEHLQRCPIIDIGGTAKALGLSFNTVSAAVAELCGMGILVPKGGSERNRRFWYESYLAILR